MSEDNKHFVHIQLTDSRKDWKLQIFVIPSVFWDNLQHCWNSGLPLGTAG